MCIRDRIRADCIRSKAPTAARARLLGGSRGDFSDRRWTHPGHRSDVHPPCSCSVSCAAFSPNDQGCSSM
eukprot:4417308-Pyramimonas_sp.AAC.1